MSVLSGEMKGMDKSDSSQKEKKGSFTSKRNGIDIKSYIIKESLYFSSSYEETYSASVFLKLTSFYLFLNDHIKRNA